MQSSPSSKPHTLSGGHRAPSRSAQRISSSVQQQPESSRCFVHQSSATWWSPGPSSMAGQGSTSCPWKHSTISKCPTTSFSQPSLSPESPTAPVPIGQVRLPVTFGARDNYRTELIDFDVAHIRLPYNAIL